MLRIIRDPMSNTFGEELKMYKPQPVKVPKEIEGCWSMPRSRILCRNCGTRLKKVPRKGHINSPFWINEIPDGQILKACPNGCLEKDAEAAMLSFLQDREFKNGSSWDWVWDLTKIRYGWLTPVGRFLFCEHMGHLYVLPDNIDSYGQAERVGYIKFTSCGTDSIEFSWGKKPSKYQRKIITDCATDRKVSINADDLLISNYSVLIEK